MAKARYFKITQYGIILFTASLITLGVVGSVKADIISFIDYFLDGESLQGVDGDTSGWSSGDSLVGLGTDQWSLLNGTALVKGYRWKCSGTLSHRGTRGLGICGGREHDEVDTRCCCVERIEVTFDVPQWLNSFEVRSLFYEPNLLPIKDGKERGAVDFWLGGSRFDTQPMVGEEDIRDSGTKGITSFSYDTPPVVDKLVFYVPWGQWYTWQSEFAVAKMDVTATPEPVSMILFIAGGAVLTARRLRRKSL